MSRLTPGAETALAHIGANARPFEQLTITEARRGLAGISDALSTEPEAVGSVEEHMVSAGGPPVRVRIYRPEEGTGTTHHPVVLMMHGGGWALGDLETHDGFARSLCNAASAVVVAVDYRRTPEHPFPAALEDTYSVLCWCHGNLSELDGADASALFVVGDSAGGNLAAAVGLMARERGGPSIAGQILIYPVLDSRLQTGSCREFADGYFLTLQKLRWFWSMYLPEGQDGSDPLLSPLRTDDLSGLPPALVITAELDPLRDEGEAYARALEAAGVLATTIRYPGVIHAFTLMSALMPEARDAIAECARFICRTTSRRARCGDTEMGER
ncbi:UNVERIFIED_ORG: acetyl esterase [Gordonia westfalica J30]